MRYTGEFDFVFSEAEYEGDDEGDGGGLFGFIKNAAASYKENQLRKEFKEMDRDGGGFVDIAELSTYIIKEWFRLRNDRWSKQFFDEVFGETKSMEKTCKLLPQ